MGPMKLTGALTVLLAALAASPVDADSHDLLPRYRAGRQAHYRQTYTRTIDHQLALAEEDAASTDADAATTERLDAELGMSVTVRSAIAGSTKTARTRSELWPAIA
jgi:hypothetical protein